VIAFDARDGNSAIQKAEYSLDGDRWQMVYPKDGIADSKYEQFELSLDGTATGRGVMLRVSDTLNNVAGTEVPTPAAPASSGRR
jgi:hypothetical protein